MKAAMFAGILALAVLSPAHAGTVPSIQMNYQGVLRDVDDRPLSGTYDMVFRFWSDEVGGDEIMIDTHVGVVVTDGLFSVKLGGSGSVGDGVVEDGSGPGGYRYTPNVFADYGDVYLEVEIEGEVLSPRTQILAVGHAMSSRFVNGMNVAADWGFELYVDAVSGSDDNPGLWPTSPKQTIQAALDRIPFILGGDVTVYVADGTYNEALWIDRRLHKSFYMIYLIGNEGSPQNVVLDGQGALSDGLLVLDLVEIAGFTITGYLEQGIEFFNTYGAVRNCVITGNGLRTEWAESGLSVGRSTVDVANTAIDNNQAYGVELFGGILELDNVSVSGNGDHGIFARKSSSVEFDGVITVGGNAGYGVSSEENSCVDFQGNPTITVLGNGGGDMRAATLSSVLGYGPGTTGACVAADSYSMCSP